MGKLLPFAPTDGTLLRRIRRECRKDEKEIVEKAAWMLKVSELAGCQTDAEREHFIHGDYEI